MSEIPERLQRTLLPAARWIDRITERSGHAFCWLSLVLIVAVVVEVVSRYAFGAPTLWAYDVTWMTYGAMFMLGGAYTFYKQGHIRTDFVYNLWPLRWQAIIDGVLHLFVFFPVMIFFIIAAWESAARSWALGERSHQSPWQPPVWPLKFVILLALVHLTLQGLSEFIKSVFVIVTGRRP